ncbi:hypothetical protein TNCV_3583301 [Trichonephila clavipes]|nr:hypothetical protein TNCV_3583301 [Trichonephila clavipes]
MCASVKIHFNAATFVAMFTKYIIFLLCAALVLSQDDAQDFTDQDFDVDSEKISTNEDPIKPSGNGRNTIQYTPQPIIECIFSRAF